MADIRLKKNRLRDDLELLEGRFENRFTALKKRIPGPVQPVNYIRQYPFRSVGAAVLLGLTLGLSGKKKSGKDVNNNRSSDRIGFKTILFDELKRVAARRAASYLTEVIDKKMASEE